MRSYEISLKHLGIESRLFTSKESRDRKLTNNGHGIEEIAGLVKARLGATRDDPVIMALTAGIDNEEAAEFLRYMIFSPELESTRRSYQKRNLGYGQLKRGELFFPNALKPWVDAVLDVAENLPNVIKIVSQWKQSESKIPHFAIWYK